MCDCKSNCFRKHFNWIKNWCKIDVKNVTIRFNLANQKVDNLKEYVIRLIKKELMFQEFLAVKRISSTIKILGCTIVATANPSLAFIPEE